MSYTKQMNYTHSVSGTSTAVSATGSTTTPFKQSALISVSQSRSGSSMPGYGVIIAKGGNATTNYSAVYRKVGSSSSTAARVQWADGRSLTYSGDRFGINFVGSNSEAIASAREYAMHAAASNARSAFSAGTFTGELKEALQMLKSPANSLRKLTDQSYRRRVNQRQWYEKSPTRSRYRDALKALSDLHLEFQFGWKPLAADVGAAYDAISRSSNNPKSVKIRGFGRHTVVTPESRVAAYNVGDVNTKLGIYCSATHEATSILKGVVALKLGFGMPAFQAGSTIPDFVPTLWNLMPWSFLIDYFSNVGQCLETRAFTQLTTVNWACHSTKCVSTTNTRQSFYIDYPTGQQISGGGSSSCILTQINRERLQALSVPAFKLDNKVSDSGIKQLNIAALINGRLQDVIWKPPKGGYPSTRPRR